MSIRLSASGSRPPLSISEQLASAAQHSLSTPGNGGASGSVYRDARYESIRSDVDAIRAVISAGDLSAYASRLTPRVSTSGTVQYADIGRYSLPFPLPAF